eukprot:461786-Rhodomonas_salina.1
MHHTPAGKIARSLKYLHCSLKYRDHFLKSLGKGGWDLGVPSDLQRFGAFAAGNVHFHHFDPLVVSARDQPVLPVLERPYWCVSTRMAIAITHSQT